MNVSPTWAVDTPASLSFGSAGGTYNFSTKAVDPQPWDTLYYTIVGVPPLGYSLNSSSGLLTVLNGSPNATITIRVSDDSFAYADHVCNVTVASASTLKRWNPGHYVKTSGTDSRLDQAVYWAEIFNNMDSAAAFAPIRGVFVNVSWGSFNTTGSTYDWTALDALFVKAVSLGLKLIIPITYKNFGNSAAPNLIAPADLRATYTYQTDSGWITAVWESAIMTRYIAAMQAFANRYQDHLALESVSWSETSMSMSVVGPPPGYTQTTVKAALSTQLQRLATAAVPMFPTSWVQCCMNSLSDQLVAMLNNALSVGAGFSTPDAVDTSAVQLFRGETAANGEVPTRGDLRGRMLHEEIASSPVLADPAAGGKDYNGPASNIINWAQINKVTHLSWVMYVTYPGSTWADIQAAITADPLLHSTYPTG